MNLHTVSLKLARIARVLLGLIGIHLGLIEFSTIFTLIAISVGIVSAKPALA